MITHHYLVNCGVPVSPSNGSVGNYSHTREGATVTYICDAGFRPSMEFNSTCSNTGCWTPDPEFHNCTLVQGGCHTGYMILSIKGQARPAENLA